MQLFANNVTVFINQTVNSSNTSIILDDASKLPVLGVGDWFTITFYQSNSGVESNWEIVKVTVVSGNTLTAIRGFDGTTQREWVAGSVGQMRVTAYPLQQAITDSNNAVATANSADDKASSAIVSANSALDGLDLKADLTALSASTGSSLVGHIATGAGAVARTQKQKNDDTVSVKDFGAVGDGVTDDQVAVAAAVADANTNGYQLLWPDGTYLTTANIPNFHSVKHTGDGIVKRGTDLFYVAPRGISVTNTLYVAASGGSSTNDGLSASQAISTFHQAFVVLRNYGPTLDGNWVISAGAGVYDTSTIGTQTHITASRTRVSIQGATTSATPVALGANPLSTVNATPTVTVAHTAHGLSTGGTTNIGNTITVGGLNIAGHYVVTVINPNSYTITASSNATSTATGGGTAVLYRPVPTTILDGGGTGASSQTHGMSINGIGVLVTVKDLYFRGYDDGATGRGALLIDQRADCYAQNVHANGSSWFGVYYSQAAVGRHQSGAISGCRNGIVTDLARASIGYGATTLATGVALQGNDVGYYEARGTQGHSDYVTYEFNGTGLDVAEGSRVDAVGCEFRGNTIGALARMGGMFGDNLNAVCEFNVAQVDGRANGTDVLCHSGGLDYNHTYFEAPASYVAYASSATQVHTGTVSETAISTLFSFPKGFLKNSRQKITVKVYGFSTLTGSTALRLEAAGAALTVINFPTTPTTNAGFEYTAQIFGGSTKRLLQKIESNLSTPRLGDGSTSFNFYSTFVDLVLKAQLFAVGDSITFTRIEVIVTG